MFSPKDRSHEWQHSIPIPILILPSTRRLDAMCFPPQEQVTLIGPPFIRAHLTTTQTQYSFHQEKTMPKLLNTRICRCPKGCTQQFVRFVKHDIRRRETRPGITPNCILHTPCYDRTRYHKIVCNCPADSILYSPSIRLPFLKARPSFFSRASHLSTLLQYLPLYWQLLCLGVH